MSRLDDLIALRSELLTWMGEAPVDRRAALVAQFRATLAEIDELRPSEKKGDSVDEIAARRAARGRAGSPGSRRASG